jgi:MFS family permease
VSAEGGDGARPASARAVLGNRTFRRFWIGETTSSLGSSVTSVALPLVAVVTLHADALEAGVLTAAAWAPWLVIGLPAGAWVDRMSRRRVMLAADAVSLASFVSIPVAGWLGLLSIAQLLVVALLGGVGRVFFQTAYGIYLPSLVSPDELESATGVAQAAQSATGVAGPGVAGALTATVGVSIGLLLDAASFLVSAVCLLSIRTPERRPADPGVERSLRREIAAGVRFVATDPYLRSLTIFGAVANFGLIGIQSLTTLFLVHDLGVTPGLVGVLLASTSLGGVAGALAANAIGARLGSSRAVLVCLLVGSPCALLIPLTQPGIGLAIYVVSSIVLVAAIVAGNVLQGAWRPRYYPRDMYGRITSAGQLLNYGSIPLGALLAGVLGSALGVRGGIWCMAAIIALAPGVLLASPLPSLRDLPGPPDGREVLLSAPNSQ